MKDRKMYLHPVLREFLLFLCLFALLGTAGLSQEEEKPLSERFMSRNVKNISAEDAIRYLAQAKLGTASKIPNSNTLLVTAETAELSKARVLLELVDKKEPWVVIMLDAEQALKQTDWKKNLAENIKDVTIGDFASPPHSTESPIALVDLHNDSLIVAAPADQIDRIVSELKNISQALSTAERPEIQTPEEPNTITQPQGPVAEKTTIEQTQPTKLAGEKTENDKFFNQLMNSLQEAENVEAQLKGEPIQQEAQPTEEKIQPIIETDLSQQQEQKAQSAIETVTESKPQPEPVFKPGTSKIVEISPTIEKPAFEKRSYEPVASPLADEELELDLPEKLDILELIDLVGKHLNLDLLYDKNEVKGDVTLRVQDKIKVGELYPLLESVLRFRGFVMSRKGNLVTIVSDKRAVEIDPLLIDDEGRRPEFGDVIVTRVFTLRFINTQSAKNLLDKMKIGLQIEGIEETGKLIVTGYTYRMSRIEQLLSMIDQPGRMKQFRYRQLRFTMARNLASQVKTLAEQLGTVSVTVSAEVQQQPADPRRRGVRPTPQPSPAPQTTDTSVYLDADERTNRIIMIGMPEQLDVVETLIDSLDVAQQDLRTLRLYNIQYVGAEEVVDKLQALGIISGSRATGSRGPTGRITGQRNQPGQPQQPQQETATILTEEGLVEEPQIVIIESTNSLLINATAEQHAGIATIIAYVDAEPEQAAINYVVYPLENQDPGELAGVLNQLIQETIEETQGKDDKVVRTTTRARIEEDITIIPEPKTYSLVVYASRKNQQWISSLIKELDAYRPQVLLEVTLVKIMREDAFQFDLEAINAIPNLNNLSSIAGTIDLKRDHAVEFLSQPSAESGKLTAFYGDKHIQTLLTAMEQKKYGRVLAKPKILVNDNESGEIKAETTTTIVSAKSDTLQTADAGSKTSTSAQFNTYTSDITLNIEPHISKGEQLRLKITMNRTDFEEQPSYNISVPGSEQKLTGPTPPDLVTSKVDTVITVPNGKTIILGGLEGLDQAKSTGKVPLLGDIPIIGGLFRNINNTDEQSRLYIFVKAHILRPGEEYEGSDMERVSLVNRNRFEQYEKQMQEYEDWPGIKPKPMDPIKILDED
ncbi:MAG: hypothetical protein JW804_07130 [Sedimentisphaerales bacterium]|nr:hypothetical protein [Sedimentisphaerales bacterium]